MYDVDRFLALLALGEAIARAERQDAQHDIAISQMIHHGADRSIPAANDHERAATRDRFFEDILELRWVANGVRGENHEAALDRSLQSSAEQAFAPTRVGIHDENRGSLGPHAFDQKHLGLRGCGVVASAERTSA